MAVQALGCGSRRRSLAWCLAGGVTPPVVMHVTRMHEPCQLRIGLGESKLAAPCRPRQFGDGSDDIADQRAQATAACVHWQHAKLHRHQALLREQAAGIVELVAKQAGGRRMMQV
ncbi:MAG: hypothetical protein F4W90_04280, partial [Gammaproteobacteria bacterium]|nr:hypothetical protein [Gammaproteobacteria bacterium]